MEIEWRDIRSAILSNSINDVEYRNLVLNLVGAFVGQQRLFFALIGLSGGLIVGFLMGLSAA